MTDAVKAWGAGPGLLLVRPDGFVGWRGLDAGRTILGQLALIQELASRGTLMPVPRQLLASFGRRQPGR